MSRKYIFKNHGTKLRVYKYVHGWTFAESHLVKYFMIEYKWYKTYEEAVRGMQRYSKKYYGEKAV